MTAFQPVAIASSFDSSLDTLCVDTSAYLSVEVKSSHDRSRISYANVSRSKRLHKTTNDDTSGVAMAGSKIESSSEGSRFSVSITSRIHDRWFCNETLGWRSCSIALRSSPRTSDWARMLPERAESDVDPAELRDRNDKRNGTPRPVLPEAPVLGGSESIPPWSRSNRATTLHRWLPTKLGFYTMEVCHIHSTPD